MSSKGIFFDVSMERLEQLYHSMRQAGHTTANALAAKATQGYLLVANARDGHRATKEFDLPQGTTLSVQANNLGLYHRPLFVDNFTMMELLRRFRQAQEHINRQRGDLTALETAFSAAKNKVMELKEKLMSRKAREVFVVVSLSQKGEQEVTTTFEKGDEGRDNLIMSFVHRLEVSGIMPQASEPMVEKLDKFYDESTPGEFIDFGAVVVFHGLA